MNNNKGRGAFLRKGDALIAAVIVVGFFTVMLGAVIIGTTSKGTDDERYDQVDCRAEKD